MSVVRFSFVYRIKKREKKKKKKRNREVETKNTGKKFFFDMEI